MPDQISVLTQIIRNEYNINGHHDITGNKEAGQRENTHKRVGNDTIVVFIMAAHIARVAWFISITLAGQTGQSGQQ